MSQNILSKASWAGRLRAAIDGPAAKNRVYTRRISSAEASLIRLHGCGVGVGVGIRCGCGCRCGCRCRCGRRCGYRHWCGRRCGNRFRSCRWSGCWCSSRAWLWCSRQLNRRGWHSSHSSRHHRLNSRFNVRALAREWLLVGLPLRLSSPPPPRPVSA